jgi:hypothetical protein
MRKSKAKRRGIPWQLTKEQFKVMVEYSGYLEQPKQWGKKLAIDRIRAWNKDGTPAPYSVENCRIIGFSENCRKGAYERRGQDLPPEYQIDNNYFGEFAPRVAPF